MGKCQGKAQRTLQGQELPSGHGWRTGAASVLFPQPEGPAPYCSIAVTESGFAAFRTLSVLLETISVIDISSVASALS